MRYVASCSFGKDSLAMILVLIEKKRPLDEVIFYDTGMEFQAIYDTRDAILPLLEKNGIKYTELKPQNPMIYDMFDRPVKERNGKTHYGYSWCGGRCRWGTSRKIATLTKYCKGCMQYIGIAADQIKRIDKQKRQTKILPLVEYGMTEKDCLHFCYERGFYWQQDGIQLYDILDRVSCWCCANKNLKELRNMYCYLPKYWNSLKQMQFRTERKFKRNMSIFELEERFQKEKVCNYEQNNHCK